MTRIAILTPTLIPADAVSNDVLTMHRLLSERGHEVRIFADSSSLEAEVRSFDETLSYLTSPEDVLIYHHSIGWADGVEILTTTTSRKIIKYHNVTPPEFFEGISGHHQNLCREGRAQLPQIIESQPDLVLAASAFNKSDLTAAGSRDDETFVVPPFNHADRLQAGNADLEILDRYYDGSVNLLTVGGVRPNKGHAALIEAFAIYCYNFNEAARLFVVGVEIQSFSSYTATLRQLIDTWDIGGRILFTGAVSDESLKAYYLVADALVMTSEHEGFCVPLVEAMAMKVPIVAYESTAIPETAGQSGLLLNERDPYFMAQSIDYLLTNEPVKMDLLARGAERYEKRFSNHAIEKQFFAVTNRAGFNF